MNPGRGRALAATALRAAARVGSLAIVGLVALFLIGVGPADPRRLSVAEWLQFLAVAACLAGLLAGWRWPVAGGLVALGGLGTFYLVNVAASGRWPGGAFPLFALPAVLHLAAALLRGGRHAALPLPPEPTETPRCGIDSPRFWP